MIDSIQPLLDEVKKIQDEQLRECTQEVIEAAPINSFKLPSSRDHHLKDECGQWGNLIHTLRVVSICDTLADVLMPEQYQKDELKSAAILHDICKHGVNAEAVFIYREHPQLVRQLVSKARIVANEDVLSAIEQHMGRWGVAKCDWSDGKITLAFLLHAADCIEARADQMLAIGSDDNG